MEKYSIDGRIIPTINGGHGSGNFGHGGRPGKVGGSSKDGGSSSKSKDDKFTEGDEISYTQYGEEHKGKVIRKLSDKEKKDRAAIDNPDAGDYYEVETSGPYGGKHIVWEGRIKKGESKKTDDSSDAGEKLIESYRESESKKGYIPKKPSTFAAARDYLTLLEKDFAEFAGDNYYGEIERLQDDAKKVSDYVKSSKAKKAMLASYYSEKEIDEVSAGYKKLIKDIDDYLKDRDY